MSLPPPEYEGFKRRLRTLLAESGVTVYSLSRVMAQESSEYRQLDSIADAGYRKKRQKQLEEQAERLVWKWLSSSYPHLPSLASRMTLTRAFRVLGARVDDDFFDPRPSVDDLLRVVHAAARVRVMKEIEERRAWVVPGSSSGGFYLTKEQREAVGA